MWQKKSELTKADLTRLLKEKIQNTDFEEAKKDILPFISDVASVALWSQQFFLSILKQLVARSYF